SKYPPAKPEALLKEPLKAAVMARYVIPDIMMHRLFTASDQPACPLYPPRSHSPYPSSCNVSVISLSMLAPDAPVTTSLGRGALQEMSNCYCHPGRAGGTPIIVSIPRQSRGLY